MKVLDEIKARLNATTERGRAEFAGLAADDITPLLTIAEAAARIPCLNRQMGFISCTLARPADIEFECIPCGIVRRLEGR